MRLIHRDDDERGSAMIIAITVIMILSTLSLTVLARSLSALQSTRRSQDFSAALGGADTGVSDGLFRLDQQGQGLATGACPAGATTCTISSVAGVPGTAYTMNVLDNQRVRIRARGITNNVPHGVEAIAYRDRQFPYAIFGVDLLQFSGNATDSGIAVQPPTGESATVASNGVVDCNNHPPGTAVAYSGGSVEKCGTSTGPTPFGSYNPLPPITAASAAACADATRGSSPITPCLPLSPTPLPCPVNGSGEINQNPLPAGTYHCTQQINFPNNVNQAVAGKVTIFVFTSTLPAVDFSHAIVNRNKPDGTAGDPTDFTLNVAGAGDITTTGSSNPFVFWGMLYAPGMDVTGNGCKSEYRGAIVVKSFQCKGIPNFNFTYDTRVGGIMQNNWRVRDYTEMPSSRFGTP